MSASGKHARVDIEQRINLFVGLLLLTLGQAKLSTALEVPKLQGRINDRAGMLESGRAQELEERLRQFEQETDHQIAILIIPSLQGDALEDFSIRVADAWKIGHKGVDNGAILLIVRDDRKVRIEVGYGFEGVLPDAITSQIIREVIVPRFRDNDFSGGIEAGVNAIMSVTRGESIPESSRASSGGRVFFRGKGFNYHVFGAVFLMTVLMAFVMGMTHRTFIRGTFVGASAGFFITLLGAPGYSLALWLEAVIVGAIFGAMGSRFADVCWGGDWTGSYRDDPGERIFRNGFGGGSGGGSRGGGGGFSGGGGGFGGGGASGGW